MVDGLSVLANLHPKIAGIGSSTHNRQCRINSERKQMDGSYNNTTY